MSQMCIDGKWVACQPNKDFGKIGIREICDLGDTPGQPQKKLLLRRIAWPQAGAGDGDAPLSLTIHRVQSGPALGLRPALDKIYQENIPDGTRPSRIDSSRVYQQDISELTPLTHALVQAIQGNRPDRIWQLFHNACQALDRLTGASGGARQKVFLQLPESLAVGPDYRVVALDAEIGVDGPMPLNGEACKLYRNWFGEEGVTGTASPADASILHAQALLRFMRQLMGWVQSQTPQSPQPIAAQIVQQIGHLQQDASLDDITGWIRDNSEDWGIVIEDPPPSGVTRLPLPRVPYPTTTCGGCSWQEWPPWRRTSIGYTDVLFAKEGSGDYYTRAGVPQGP